MLTGARMPSLFTFLNGQVAFFFVKKGGSSMMAGDPLYDDVWIGKTASGVTTWQQVSAYPSLPDDVICGGVVLVHGCDDVVNFRFSFSGCGANALCGRLSSRDRVNFFPVNPILLCYWRLYIDDVIHSFTKCLCHH